jgi:hypothetical protein
MEVIRINMYNQFYEDLKVSIYELCKRVSEREITIEQAFKLADEKHDELIYKYENGIY